MPGIQESVATPAEPGAGFRRRIVLTTFGSLGDLHPYIAVALGVAWAVPAVLYVPLLSVSVGRGMLLSVFQLLLRAFLYVLLAAVVMVVLALVQIFSGTDVRGELPAGLALTLRP